MGFNEFIAKKSVCLILVRITMYILPDGNGHILLGHNEGVYNMRSWITLLSNFQLWTHRRIVDSTYKGHHGTDYQPGTQQCLETLDDDGETGYMISPLKRVMLL